MELPINPKAVANYFLDLAWSEGKDVAAMKIQKLVYVAHGWCLAIFDKPLINETVEAWEYGPVISSLYADFRDFGNDPIKEKATSVENLAIIKPEVKSVFIKKLLDKIWEIYGGFSGLELSNMTHQPNTPWDKVYNDKDRYLKNAVIGTELIKDYYKNL